ncbi:MAG: NADH-quinone oxidoreductase subunit G, partial [Gammaproteobacteria bacterium]|nr:NADH-quinone oxidoreductase subunit G [Gammaproteobacteria bacterium]
IEIDGQKLEAENGALLIEVADKAGIHIPRFCYHDKLSIAANCRMCLVEVEKSPKPLPACATPVMDGMTIYTKSPQALAAQRGTMEFLLINHPLDCPICDQGGECDLQDTAMGYGASSSDYTDVKRVVKDKNLGSLINTDMTRCIHCTRCVRFGQEIAGIMELGVTGRGEHMEIGTYIEESIDSELSGNMIDLCPVGALTSKPFRYTSRPWELSSSETIAPHDCLGSNIVIHSSFNEIKRALPRDNEDINECWISDRDRFSYEGLNNDRLLQPMVKERGEWQEVDWQTALTKVAQDLGKIKDQHGASQIGALLSPSSTLEESFLLQKLMRGLGSSNVDHRLRQQDFSADEFAPDYPSLGMRISELDQLNAALLIGSNIRKEQPIAGHRLRKATLAGAKVSFVNGLDYEFSFAVSKSIVAVPSRHVGELAGIAKALVEKGASAPDGIALLVDDVTVTESHRVIAQQLSDGDKSAVILGTQSLHHYDYAGIKALATAIAKMSNSSVGVLTDGANSPGAWLAGAVPHRVIDGAAASRSGLNTQQMLIQHLKAYVLLGIEPEFDIANAAQAINGLSQAELTVMLTPYVTDSMRAYADVLLPVGPFSETSGTFVNIEGSWQSFAGSVASPGEARPAWKVLRVLGNLCHIEGFDYTSSEEVRDDIVRMTSDAPNLAGGWCCPTELKASNDQLQIVSDIPIYAVDATVRRSQALQDTIDAKNSQLVGMNSRCAEKYGLSNADQVHLSTSGTEISLPLQINERVPDDCVYIPIGVPTTVMFDFSQQAVQIQR